ncbi:DUF3139 domain-containing protein [Paenibacillus sp. MMS20-IR301]|uniref:DUF3139 domain-containing protein n=1 Tax=Paenibacillus sp. MMS20-IR301 TaxID=2895946 RepID=UPI0028ED44C4|nr:DUF3139 domain-containing protein [Paenibacillus sp. MMS20-IR301]WNS44253.1 DUF3139 domain-containing protein [Paenibacillus sp. MMS20-IR301]
MSAAKKTVIGVLAGLIILLIVVPTVYVQVNKRLYAHRVMSYLLHEKHYSREEIASARGIWSVKLPPFLVKVKFSDEPEVEYTYFAHNEVLQFSHEITQTGLEQGISDADLKHYVPME